MKIRNLCHSLVALLSLASTPCFSEQEKLSLATTISGALPNKGQVIFSLFSSAENFLKQAVNTETKPINKLGEAAFIIQLKPGTYAVSIIYDEDSNGELNTSFLGIPTEPVGFSNDARGTFGPPSYEDASFSLDTSKTIRIILEQVGH